MYPESSKGLNRETDKAVYFFTPAFHPFDNFSAHRVTLWGKEFPTAEHAFQWKKFFVAEPESAERIFYAASPHIVKEISDANRHLQPDDWSDRRVSVMREILSAKVAQHEDVRELLRKTGNREIIENSPVDSFWGVGPDGNGENVVGKIFMEIRDSLTVKR